MRKACWVSLLVSAGLAVAGCGSDSAGDSAKPAAPASQSAASSTASYRSAVNALFDPVVAARGSYQAAHGETALRASAVAIEKADDAALSRLTSMHVPGTAKALQSQLVESLRAQKAAVESLLDDSKLNTEKLGDAVLISNDTEQLVSQINALP